MHNYKITLNLGTYLFTCTYFTNSLKSALNMAKNEFIINNYKLVSYRVSSFINLN